MGKLNKKRGGQICRPVTHRRGTPLYFLCFVFNVHLSIPFPKVIGNQIPQKKKRGNEIGILIAHALNVSVDFNKRWRERSTKR